MIRYDILSWSTRFCKMLSNEHEEVQNDEGEYCKWEDVEEIIEENKRLKKLVEFYEDYIGIGINK